MLTTDIADTETPYAEDILRSMSELGIKHYRWGGFKYNRDTPLAKQLAGHSAARREACRH